MKDIFYDVDNFFGFGSPKFKFNAPLKDMSPSYLTPTKNGYQILVKCLGLADIDAKLSETRWENGRKETCICVEGKNEIANSKFNTKVEIPISDDVLASLKEITYRVECGIAVINLICERKEQEIKIKKI